MKILKSKKQHIHHITKQCLSAKYLRKHWTGGKEALSVNTEHTSVTDQHRINLIQDGCHTIQEHKNGYNSDNKLIFGEAVGESHFHNILDRARQSNLWHAICQVICILSINASFIL